MTAPPPTSPVPAVLRDGWRLELLIIGLFLGAVVISLIEGTPSDLPGVALGSAALLHLERAAAALAIAVAIASVLAQAARGRLPTQLQTAGVGLAYDVEAASEAEAAVEGLQRQVDELQEQIRTLAELALVEDGAEATDDEDALVEEEEAG